MLFCSWLTISWFQRPACFIVLHLPLTCSRTVAAAKPLTPCRRWVYWEGQRVPNGHFSVQWERCISFKLLIVRVYLFSRCSQRTGFRPMGTPMREVGVGSARLNGPECRHSTVSYHCQDDLEMKAMDFRRYEKWETTGISHWFRKLCPMPVPYYHLQSIWIDCQSFAT